MSFYDAGALQRAIKDIYPNIEAKVPRHWPSGSPGERALWWELSCCCLSSQVPYDVAVAAADAIDANGCLSNHSQLPTEALSIELLGILSTPLYVNGNHRLYRFRFSKADQLARMKSEIVEQFGSLNGLVHHFSEAYDLRVWLVKNAPGIGPKQASMFARNTGISYDLAIIDRHVLDYMHRSGLFVKQISAVSSFGKYCHLEDMLRDHAQSLGVVVGLLDWAIWIVMRAAKSLESEIKVV
ncbi:hypothetical protein [Celeribacter sp.]|uniref:8-oxoguanine DNA glycosylase n=1 Tax=Celeribacter sp. TaxID=1890673 RepID=UPI003A9297A3